MAATGNDAEVCTTRRRKPVAVAAIAAIDVVWTAVPGQLVDMLR